MASNMHPGGLYGICKIGVLKYEACFKEFTISQRLLLKKILQYKVAN